MFGSTPRRRPTACRTLALLGFVLAAAPGRATAQHCHAHAPVAESAVGLRAGLTAEAATYRRDDVSGEYEGLWALASLDLAPVTLKVALPAYRIVRNNEVDYGFGDFEVDLRLAIFGDAGSPWTGGVVLASTLPTGARGKDLGMGHVMAMPGLWFGARGAATFMYGQLQYGRALADISSGAGAGAGVHAGHEHGATHVHGGPGPIVNPMNGSEITGAVTGGYWFESWVRGRAGTYGGVPVGVTEGVSRLALFAGGDLVFDTFDVGMETHVRVVGQPFDLKLMLSGGARF